MEDKKIYRTEEELLAEEAGYMQWIVDYRVHTAEYIDKMNEWMVSDNPEVRKQLIVLSHNKDFVEYFGKIDDIAYMLVVAGIYESEIGDGIYPTIIDIYNTVDELLQYIKKLKFLLWKIDFVESPEVEENFMKYMEEKQTSIWTIRYLIHTTVPHKAYVLSRLACIYLEKEMVTIGFLLLKDANEAQPGDSSIVVPMADICIRAGKIETALDLLKTIQEPSEEVKKIIQKVEQKHE